MSVTVKLPKSQQALLDAMAGGVICTYVRHMWSSNSTPYYVRSDSIARCTVPARALLAKGLVEKFDVKQFGEHRLRIKK